VEGKFICFAFILTVVKVVYGEKISFYSITEDATGFQVKFASNSGNGGLAPLTEKNYQFLFRRISDLGTPQKTIITCSRSYILVTTLGGAKEQTWAACIRGRNKLALKLNILVRDLSRLF
jgi:hypothetical protein